MNKFNSDQEEFWAGEFGDAYIDRNVSPELFAANVALFSEILKRAPNIDSAIEFGANVGLNLRAIQTLAPKIKLTGIEINAKAASILKKDTSVEVFHESIFDFNVTTQWDLAFTKTVLIHIAPDLLPKAYEKLYQASKKYICVAEYYNPTPTEVTYRGHSERLFKRDFAGELMGHFPDLKLVDYGFIYKRDPNFPQDDITWFLMSKE